MCLYYAILSIKSEDIHPLHQATERAVGKQILVVSVGTRRHQLPYMVLTVSTVYTVLLYSYSYWYSSTSRPALVVDRIGPLDLPVPPSLHHI